MNKYNFDLVVDRTNTQSSKWAMLEDKGLISQVIPCWIADMEFAMLPELKQAIIDRLQCPVLGYTDQKIELKQLICDWYNTRYKYSLTKDQLIITTGVVFSLVNAINVMTDVDDTIILPTPYYHRFKDSIVNSNRNVLYTKMTINNMRYEIDYNDLRNKINSTCKAIIICNPHNPSGTIYTKKEIDQLVAFCKEYKLKIISDEIHSDFCFDKNVINIVNYNDYTKENAISLLSLSKSFNLASFKVGFSVIANKDLRKRFNKLAKHTGITSINTFGLIAIETCYKYGHRYIDELNDYIYQNKLYCYNFIKEKMPDILVNISDGTYLLWLNLTRFSSDDKKLRCELMEIAKILPSQGGEFGIDYQGYVRINVACSRKDVITIMEGLYRYYGR